MTTNVFIIGKLSLKTVMFALHWKLIADEEKLKVTLFVHACSEGDKD